jgi:lysine biosynthesis protein LysW
MMKGIPPASRTGEPRFLIVDDNSGTVGELAPILRDRGYRVEVARSGDEALAKMVGVFFDCVLSEAHTSGMSGVDLCRAVKAQCPDTRVLLVTAYAEDGLVQRAWDAPEAAGRGPSTGLSVCPGMWSKGGRRIGMTVTRAACPKCKQRIELDSQLEIGEEVICSRCGADWQVVSRSPLVLDWTDEGFESLGAGRLGLRNTGTDSTSVRRLWPTR